MSLINTECQIALMFTLQAVSQLHAGDGPRGTKWYDGDKISFIFLFLTLFMDCLVFGLLVLTIT